MILIMEGEKPKVYIPKNKIEKMYQQITNSHSAYKRYLQHLSLSYRILKWMKRKVK